MLGSGRPAAEVLAELDERRQKDPDVHGDRLFGLVYPTGRKDIEALIGEVYQRFLFSNALNPRRFTELAKIEQDVISTAAGLVHRAPGDKPAGTMTSGGTESILMSMLTNRERARSRGIEHPQVLAPESAHPAYAKAAHYFGMDYASISLDDDYRADVGAARSLVNERTCVIVASAYSYPHGALDPVPELAALAAGHGAGCHVDACIGGFVLPFLEMLGRPVPPWDFRVDGVTEISMDLHKYGYVPKGASVILHRDDDWFSHQVFFYDKWGSGLYGTPAIAGARTAAPIVAAWALGQYLGVEGYLEIVRDLCATTDRVRQGIEAIDELQIVGDPIGPLLALKSDQVDLYAVADVMDDRGWYLNRNTKPYGLHFMLSPIHGQVVGQFLDDLAYAVAHHGPNKGKQARYS
jgi:glutamate/tyrosine decarboxylase-like PLP-dependent enzyme